jgi:uncharacterized membrane protein YhaH (DUF805 family)
MSIWQVFFSFKGRIPRQTFWLAYLVLFVVSACGMALVVYLMTGELFPKTIYVMPVDRVRVWGPVFLAMNAVTIWPMLAVILKRWHDRNRPTWVYLIVWAISLIPLGMRFAGYGPTSAELERPDWFNSPGLHDPVLQITSLVVGLLVLYPFIELGFLRGTRGPNQYGEDPLPPEPEAVPGAPAQRLGFFSWMFGLNGRISRSHWWLGVLITFGILVAALALYGLCMWLVMPFNDPALMEKMGNPHWAETPEGAAFMMKAGLLMMVPTLLLPVPFWNLVALGVKRLHDRGATGWWIMAFIVPFFAALLSPAFFVSLPEAQQHTYISGAWLFYGVTVLWAFIRLGMLGGNEGANRYGPPPAG